MEIGGECIAAVAQPFDRAAQSSRRPGDYGHFRIGVVADAEISADIARDHADRGGRYAKDGSNVVTLPNYPTAGRGI